MNSQIILGKIHHRRSWPVEHQFTYPIYFYRFDIDDLPHLNQSLPGFGYNHFSLVRMDDKDYLWRGSQPIKDKLARAFEKIGYTEPITRIELISFARYWNLIFRPVSFFVCYDADNRCRLILTEVHNTFGETHLYPLKDPETSSQTLSFKAGKAFHVSPFFDLQGDYQIKYTDDRKNLDITITLTRPNCGTKPVLTVRLTGTGMPLTTRSLYMTLLKYPFSALLNMPRILRQALTLYVRKKLPFFPKPVPQSEDTMRKQAPSWLARLGLKLFFSFLETQSVGRLTVTLPEGETRSFGPPDTDKSASLHVLDYRFFSLLAAADEIGFGIAYEKGYWKSDNLVALMELMLNVTLSQPALSAWHAMLIKGFHLIQHRYKRNTVIQAQKNIACHYDLSNAMYRMFLDETMSYSCAVFDNVHEPLAVAQRRKIDRILDKSHLTQECHLLEIGSGWGELAIRAVQRFGCRVTTLTLSAQQQQLAQQRIAEAKLADRIEVQLCDYRNVTGQYDRIVSVEMLEAVGKRYYPCFFRRCDQLLKPSGLVVIQTIVIPDQQYETYSKMTDWMRTFIFPGGLLPSLTALAKTLTSHTTFVIQDVESIGQHYALTLAQWRKQFMAHREDILKLGFDESFIRRWEYYFSYCQAGFAQHYTDDLQIVLTRSRNRTCIAAFKRHVKSLDKST